MKKISADYLFDGLGTFHKDKVLIYDDAGTILSIDHKSDHDSSTVEHLSGKTLCPGLINTHCHLELSHMKGLVDTGTTLLPFLKNVVKFRDFPQDVIDAAIVAGDQEMYDAGIVAVGDISNKADTAAVKSESTIDYYTFVEMFDFMMPFMTEQAIAQYSEAYEGQSNSGRNKKSYVPHAPYTVSKELFEYINKHNDQNATVSLHNQETREENLLFTEGTGGFIDFFTGFGFDMSGFKATGARSIHYAMAHMQSSNPTLLVHNTTCNSSDLQAAKLWNDNLYFATCPNANLYIENSLPDYQVFLDEAVTMTIGTDSLTSNWQLSVLEEVLAIQKYCSYVTLEQLLTWATSNGAKALGFDDLRGSFVNGKQPGILAINAVQQGDKFALLDGDVRRII